MPLIDGLLRLKTRLDIR